MAYTISVTANYTTVTSVSTQTRVVVTATATPIFTITNTVQSIGITDNLTTITVYTDAVELLVDDFANYYTGDWVSGRTYRRGHIANYEYSLYVCSTGTYTSLTSSVTPPDDLGYLSTPDSLGNYSNGNWRRVVWNEAPRDFLTVTNHLRAGSLSVGGIGGDGLTINNTATFNGPVKFNNTITSGITVLGTSTFLGTSKFLGPVNFNTTVSGVVTSLIAGAGIDISSPDGNVTVSSRSANFTMSADRAVRAGFNYTSGTASQTSGGTTYYFCYITDTYYDIGWMFYPGGYYQTGGRIDSTNNNSLTVYYTTASGKSPKLYVEGINPIWGYGNDDRFFRVATEAPYADFGEAYKFEFRYRHIIGAYNSYSGLTQARDSIFIGTNEGDIDIGQNSIFIGKNSSDCYVTSGTIVLNAVDQNEDWPREGQDYIHDFHEYGRGFYVRPMSGDGDATDRDGVLWYDRTRGQLTYQTLASTTTNYAVYFDTNTKKFSYENKLNLNFGKIVN